MAASEIRSEGADFEIGQCLRLGVRAELQSDGRAFDRAFDARAGIEHARCRDEARRLTRIRFVELGHDQAIRDSRLAPAQRLAPELREPMQGVDADNRFGHNDVMNEHGMSANRLEDRCGIGQTARFERDALEPRFARRSATPQITQSHATRDKLVPRLTAGAAAGQDLDARHALEKRVIDGRRGGFVDDHMRVFKQALMQLVPKPGRLAGAEKAAQQREPHPAFARFTHLLLLMKLGSKGSNGRPIIRSVARQTSSNFRNGLVAGHT